LGRYEVGVYHEALVIALVKPELEPDRCLRAGGASGGQAADADRPRDPGEWVRRIVQRGGDLAQRRRQPIEFEPGDQADLPVKHDAW
jgi:hypothetical protein